MKYTKILISLICISLLFGFNVKAGCFGEIICDNIEIEKECVACGCEWKFSVGCESVSFCEEKTEFFCNYCSACNWEKTTSTLNYFLVENPVDEKGDFLIKKSYTYGEVGIIVLLSFIFAIILFYLLIFLFKKRKSIVEIESKNSKI